MEKLDIIKSKIYSSYTDIEFLKMLAFLNFKNKNIVFTNGCFDIIHRGHIEYLAQSAQLGDSLIIGLNSDKSVTKLKGTNRPIQDQQSRALILASMQFVSAVVIFSEETPYELINVIKPKFLIKGSDYSIENIVGNDIVIANGGEVRTIDFIEGYSSSSIINKI